MTRVLTPEDPLWSLSLPRFRDPRPGESLASYVLWLDELNCLPAGAVLRMIRRHASGPAALGQPGNFVRGTSFDLGVLAELAGGLDVRLLDDLTAAPALRSLLGDTRLTTGHAKRFKICPACIASREIPLVSLFGPITTCDRHGLRLVASCTCGASIQLFVHQSPFTCHELGCERAYESIPTVLSAPAERDEQERLTSIYRGLVGVRVADPVPASHLGEALRCLIVRSRVAVPARLTQRTQGRVSLRAIADILVATRSGAEELVRLLRDLPAEATSVHRSAAAGGEAARRELLRRGACPNPACTGFVPEWLGEKPLLAAYAGEWQCRACGSRYTKTGCVLFSFDTQPDYSVRRAAGNAARVEALRERVWQTGEQWIAEDRTVTRDALLREARAQPNSIPHLSARAGLVPLVNAAKLAQRERRLGLPGLVVPVSSDAAGRKTELFRLARAVGVREACRQLGFQPSAYYRWKQQLGVHGPAVRVSGGTTAADRPKGTRAA